MISERDPELQEFRVVVHAIVGGPFDLRMNEVIGKAEIGEWQEPFVRLGAIEPIVELFLN